MNSYLLNSAENMRTTFTFTTSPVFIQFDSANGLRSFNGESEEESVKRKINVVNNFLSLSKIPYDYWEFVRNCKAIDQQDSIFGSRFIYKVQIRNNKIGESGELRSKYEKGKRIIFANEDTIKGRPFISSAVEYTICEILEVNAYPTLDACLNENEYKSIVPSATSLEDAKELILKEGWVELSKLFVYDNDIVLFKLNQIMTIYCN